MRRYLKEKDGYPMVAGRGYAMIVSGMTVIKGNFNYSSCIYLIMTVIFEFGEVMF